MARPIRGKSRKKASEERSRKRREAIRAEKAGFIQAPETEEPRDLDPLMEPLRKYLLDQAGSEEGFPFGPDVMVFKVAGKMFALLVWEEVPVTVSLKCDPERSLELREEHVGINGAYHMNKKHWHSVVLGDSVDMALAQELIDQSYELVVATLPGKVQERLRGLS